MKPGYYAITTTGCGWHILAGPHPSIDEAEERARELIGTTPADYVTEIHRASEQANLKVVVQTRLYHYGIDLQSWQDEQLEDYNA